MLRITSVVFALGLLCAPALAQDDHAAGLFAEARQLPLVSQSIAVRVAGGEAEIELSQIFHNGSDAVAQADYQLYLPEGTTVTAFGFYQGDRFLAAELKTKQAAEDANRQAAEEGRATGLLEREDAIHEFSVYPLEAHADKRIEITLRTPVVMEMGKSHLRIPIDRFLGQPGASSTVLVQLASDEPLTGFGVDGAPHRVLEHSARTLSLALSTRAPVDVWWHEQVPPLLLRAQSLPLPDRPGAVQLRVVLNDAGDDRNAYDSVALIVDSSFSMRRKAAALRALIGRVIDVATAPVSVHAVAERHVRLGEIKADDALAAIVNGDGHRTGASDLRAVVAELGCDRSKRVCIVVTDAQLPEIQSLRDVPATLVVLGDPHELAYLGERLPERAERYDVDADPPEALLALADRAVLPVLEIDALTSDGKSVALIGGQSARVAEGGMLRVFAGGAGGRSLEVSGRIAGHAFTRSVPIEPIDPAADAGQALRRGLYGAVLGDMMDAYRRTPDATLEAQITAISLREGIPTAFTALQVDDPRLSLYEIKPGDPLLSVPNRPGVRAVTAFYPFGATRRLVLDQTGRSWSDRFLVPRGFPDRLYRVDVFLELNDGSVKAEHVWYRLDETGPQLSLTHDPDNGVLRIEASGEELGLAAVQVHVQHGVLNLSPVAEQWLVPTADLPAHFVVVARDHAGNATRFDCQLTDGVLRVEGERVPAARKSSLGSLTPSLRATGEGLAQAGDSIALSLDDGGTVRFASADVRLGSLARTSLLQLDAHSWLFGTRTGDLVEVACSDHGCHARTRTARFAARPITGLARLPSGRILIGVLSEGLFELDGERIARSKLRVGSRAITGVLALGDEVFIASADRGLWHVTGERAARPTRFAYDHVGGIALDGGTLVVDSGYGRFRRTPEGRFASVAASSAQAQTGSPDLTAAVTHRGQTFVAGFDGGLMRVRGSTLERVALALSPAQARINALASDGTRLWLGTEAGLLVLEGDGDRAKLVRGPALTAAVHGLAYGPKGLAVATSAGVYVVSADGGAQRIDFQRGAATARFVAVAWHDGALYAGGMDGLYRFSARAADPIGAADGFDAHWVTALYSDGARLWVGTYADGVYKVEGKTAARVPGLAAQWVPPHAITRIGAHVWIGGTGMPPVRIDAHDHALSVPLPVRDSNGFFADGSELGVLTNDGVVHVQPETTADPTPSGAVCERL